MGTRSSSSASSSSSSSSSPRRLLSKGRRNGSMQDEDEVDDKNIPSCGYDEDDEDDDAESPRQSRTARSGGNSNSCNCSIGGDDDEEDPAPRNKKGNKGKKQQQRGMSMSFDTVSTSTSPTSPVSRKKHASAKRPLGTTVLLLTPPQTIKQRLTEMFDDSAMPAVARDAAADERQQHAMFMVKRKANFIKNNASAMSAIRAVKDKSLKTLVTCAEGELMRGEICARLRDHRKQHTAECIEFLFHVHCLSTLMMHTPEWLQALYHVMQVFIFPHAAQEKDVYSEQHMAITNAWQASNYEQAQKLLYSLAFGEVFADVANHHTFQKFLGEMLAQGHIAFKEEC